MRLSFLNNSVSLNSRWQPAPHIAWTRQDDRVAVVDNQEGKVYYFNGTGAEMWESLCKKITAAEIAALIADRYQSPLKTIQRDTLSFIAQLRGQDLIENASF